MHICQAQQGKGNARDLLTTWVQITEGLQWITVLALPAVVPYPGLVFSRQLTGLGRHLKFSLLVLGCQANNPAGIKVAAGDATSEVSPAQSPLVGLSQDRSVAVVSVYPGITSLAEHIAKLTLEKHRPQR